MIIVPIKEGENIEKALKKFKRKFEKTGVVRELRSRKQFEKPSVKRRNEIKKAIYVQHLRGVSPRSHRYTKEGYRNFPISLFFCLARIIMQIELALLQVYAYVCKL